MKIVDLTHTIKENMPVFPGTEPPTIERICSHEEYGFREAKISMYSHTGTHMDAPAHMIVDGLHLDELDISQFIGTAIVVDCVNIIRDITIEHLKEYEEEISMVDFVLLRTDWDKKWNEPSYFKKFPAITEEAAKYLATFNLKGLGVDAISVDLMTSKDFEVHKILLSKNMVMIENLTNLEEVQGKIFTLSVLPLKTIKADGSPIRAIGMI